MATRVATYEREDQAAAAAWRLASSNSASRQVSSVEYTGAIQDAEGTGPVYCARTVWRSDTWADYVVEELSPVEVQELVQRGLLAKVAECERLQENAAADAAQFRRMGKSEQSIAYFERAATDWATKATRYRVAATGVDQTIQRLHGEQAKGAA